MKRKLLSLVLALALVLTCVPSFGSITASAADDGATLMKLVIDEIPVLSPQFNPEVTQYQAETYVSVEKATVYPIAASKSAVITVNGETPNANGRVTVPLTLGENQVAIKVTSSEGEKEYKVSILKHDTDYEGMKRVPQDAIQVSSNSTADGSAAANMFDGDDSTWWRASHASQPGNEVVLNFDLGQIYTVNHMWFTFLPKNLPLQNSGDYSKSGKIWASQDGINWTLVLDKAAYRSETGNIRYELGDVKARYLRYQVATFNHNATVINAIPQIGEMDIYYNPDPKTPDYPEPGNAPAYVPSNDKLSRGTEITLEKGLQITTWLPSPGYGRKAMNSEDFQNSYMTGPLFYDPPMFNVEFMKENPNMQWALAKAPWGANHMGGTGAPRDFITDEMRPYINNLVSVCFGDEGGYSQAEAISYGQWFDISKALYPQAMVHTNQWAGQWSTAQLKEYMRIAEPDLLAFDAYYWDEVGGLKDWDAPRSLLSNANYQREAALGGLDGTGTKPIVFGQYLGCYKNGSTSFGSGWYEATASQKNAVLYLSLAVGMKWFDLFRTEYEFGSCYLFDEDGRPTRHYYEWAEAFQQARNIEDQILRLNSDYVVSVPGQHPVNGSAVSNNAPGGYRMGSFAANTSKNLEYYIKNISVQNLGQENGGLPGDVALGYFTTLPGLEEADFQQYFGCKAPKGFMVVNGLLSGNGQRPERQHGSLEETAQQITLTFEGNTAPLKKVNKDTGEIEDVTLTANGDGTSSLTLTLGGGVGELYFWAENDSQSIDDSNSSASSSTAAHPASLAFDGNPTSFWQAEANAQLPITIEKRFDQMQSIGKVVLNEEGSAITAFKLQYQATPDGEWMDIPNGSGTTIGVSTTVRFDEVTAYGLRLVITAAEGQVSMGEIRSYTGAQEKTIDINDTDMGTGVNRIEYGGDWLYSEPNRTDVAPIVGNDFHFSKWDGATATIHFYGTKLELFGRGFGNSSDATIQIDGGDVLTISRSTSGNFKSVYTSPNMEQKLHTAVITCSKRSSDSKDVQWIIDGARVTYTGSIPSNPEGSTITTYLDDNNASITYHPQSSNAVAEGSGWRITPQSGNTGYTSTTLAESDYEIAFNGTDVSIFAPKAQLGTAAFYLDGELVEGGYVTTGNQDGNALCVKSIHAGDINEDHVLKVVAVSGRSRIDYATVTALADTGGSTPTPEEGYSIKVTKEGNGTVTPTTLTVLDHEDAILTLAPDAGWVVASILVDGEAAALTDQNTFILYDVTANHEVQVVFGAIQALKSVEELTAVTVDYGTDFRLLEYSKLPKTVTVTLEDNTETTVPVQWSSEGYNSNQTGLYTLTGTLQLPKHISNASGISARISVQVQAVKSTLNELLATARAVAEGTYSDATYQRLQTAIGLAQLAAEKENATQQEINEAAEALRLAIDTLKVDVTAFRKALSTAEALKAEDYTAGSFQQLQPAIDAAKAVYNTFGVTQTKLDEQTKALTDAMGGLVTIQYLAITVGYAEKQSTEGVVPAVKERFEKALQKAKNVLSQADATQEEVDAADEELIEILQYLEFKGDPTELLALIAEAEKIDLLLYEDGAIKDAFAQALTDAKDTAENYPLTAELAKAQAALEEAIKNLETVKIPQIDLTKLQEKVDQAKPMYENLESYIDNAARAQFKAVYELALQLLENPTTQVDVDDAVVALHRAMLELRLKPSKEALQKLIEEAERKDLSQYTEESAQVLREALKAAKSVMENALATEEEVDVAGKELQEAMMNLQKKSDGSSSKPEDNNSKNPSGDSSQGGTSTTGDSFPYLVLLTMGMALAVIVLVKKRRSQES